MNSSLNSLKGVIEGSILEATRGILGAGTLNPKSYIKMDTRSLDL